MIPNKLDLALVWPSINPYWATRLSALEASGNVRFECWLLDRDEEGRDWVITSNDLNFEHQLLPVEPRQSLTTLARLYRGTQPEHILSMHFDPKLWGALAHRALFRKDLAFYVEKTWDSWITRTRTREMAKHLVFRQATTIFTPGADAIEWVRPYVSNDVIFRHLPHSVDLTAFDHARVRRQPCDHVRFLYLGRYVEEKGLASMMQGFELAATRLPPASFSLATLGSGPLDERLRIWGANQTFDVSIGRFVQPRELVAELADHDVLIFPTLGDPYGLVVNEAFAAGMPVIASDHAGEISERIGSATASPRGWIHKAGSSTALAAKIVAAVTEPLSRNSRAATAHSYANEHFGVDRWVDAIEDWALQKRT